MLLPAVRKIAWERTAPLAVLALPEPCVPVSLSASLMTPVPEPDSRTDQALVDGINAGDESAFEALYQRYRDWVVRLAYRFTGREADALDVLQETFSYLLRKAGNLQLSGAMTTFLYPAVKNLSLSMRRKCSRAGEEAFLNDVPAQPAMQEGDCRAELAAVMARLSDVHREVVLMRFVDDMSLEEIAQALQVPVGTVKSRLHNALRMLREDLWTREYFEA